MLHMGIPTAHLLSSTQHHLCVARFTPKSDPLPRRDHFFRHNLALAKILPPKQVGRSRTFRVVGLSPNIVTFTSLIQAAVEAEDMDRAERWLQDWQKRAPGGCQVVH